jgi:hypothetical protein
MVPQDTDRRKPSVRSAFIDSLYVLVESPLVAGEVAGIRDDVRSERPDGGKRSEEVAVVHLRTDVEIAQLRQSTTLKVTGQAFDRQHSSHNLEPMGLDLPGVATDSQGGTEGGERHLQEATPSDHGVLDAPAPRPDQGGRYAKRPGLKTRPMY